jgi:manganese transport protein
VAAAVFHAHGLSVTSIAQASTTLEPLVGHLAQLLFGIALLLAGVGSSITASMAEANVIAGLLGRPEDPQSWFYRVSLFATALPALVVVATQADSFRVLILSQVVLSIQLPFTILPLLLLTGDRRLMGEHASGPRERVIAWSAGLIVVGLNLVLLYHVVRGGH